MQLNEDHLRQCKNRSVPDLMIAFSYFKGNLLIVVVSMVLNHPECRDEDRIWMLENLTDADRMLVAVNAINSDRVLSNELLSAIVHCTEGSIAVQAATMLAERVA